MSQLLSQRAAQRLALALLLLLLALAFRRQPLIVTYHNISAYLTEAQQEYEQGLMDTFSGMGVHNCPAP